MRQNIGYRFHTMIIALFCCAALTGCGHKTSVVYVADDTPQSGQVQTHNR